MFTVIVSPVTDAIGKAVPAAGSVALGYVLVTLLPSVSQVNDNETKMKNLQTRSNITTSYMKFEGHTKNTEIKTKHKRNILAELKRRKL